MKLKLYFSILAVAINITVVSAQQVAIKENAIRVAALVPGTGGDDDACGKLNTKPCAVINKSQDRTITVKVEQSFLINNELSTRILVLDDLAPNENRYLGCAGCTKDDYSEKCTGYKIVMAYYEQADSVRVRQLFSDDQRNAVTVK